MLLCWFCDDDDDRQRVDVLNDMIPYVNTNQYIR